MSKKPKCYVCDKELAGFDELDVVGTLEPLRRYVKRLAWCECGRLYIVPTVEEPTEKGWERKYGRPIPTCPCCLEELRCPNCGNNEKFVGFYHIRCFECGFIVHSHGNCPYAVSGYDDYHDCKHTLCPFYPKK